METKPPHQLEDHLEDDPIIDQDTTTQVFKGMEETLQPSDDRSEEAQSARTQSEADDQPTQDLTGTHRDQTGEDETMATDS